MGLLNNDTGGIDALSSQKNTGAMLYDELKKIDIYSEHRETLRPWDRRLPNVVTQEANRRAMWILKPPPNWFIFLVAVFSILSLEMILVLPFVWNLDRIHATWSQIPKPNVIYNDGRVLVAVAVICHLSSGFALWFVYLTEGFSKHQLELTLFACTVFGDCFWMDIVFYTGRLDWALIDWCCICFFTIATIVALVVRKVDLAAVFLLPQLAGSIAVIIYLIAFIDLVGPAYEPDYVLSR